ncbi:MAG: serine/threonine protein kinase [Planctomycetes bacterium]|nr:serine/threonine protein kinase [Planctomycetota bacterium]
MISSDSDSDAQGPKESTVFQSAPFGKYTLLKKLGKGGMGRVFEAVDTVLSRRVAIKMMAPSDPYGLEGPEVDEERFLREAQVSASLAKHPHIVSVYEAGVIEGKRYLAMEFIEGRQMQDWRRGVPIRDQLALLRDIALAVHHANENGIVHRDLKPANVIVDAKNRPHVTDFGLAKAQAPEFSRSITTSGLVVGTPAYMSPEQAQGLKAVDGRSDVYSLGVMMYEMLTDRHPFDAETAMQLLVKVIEHPPPPPSTVVGEEGHVARDPRLEAICLKALAKKPEDRPASARVFADDLSGWLAETGASGPLLKPEPPARKASSRWWIAAAAAALALAAGLAWLLGSPDAPPSVVFARANPVIEGHTDSVLAVAFSPRGDLLASGGADRQIVLRAVPTGAVKATLGPHAGKVEALAFSPDGSLIAAVTEAGDAVPGEVKLWETATGRLRADLRGHPGPVNCVAFSPDGALLVTGDLQGNVRFWDPSAGRPAASIPRAHEDAVRAVAFTKDGRSLVTASWDQRAKLWDVETRRERLVYRGHAQGLWGAAISPDGTRLATASSDHTVKLWDLATGAERRTIQAHSKEVAALAFSPDGRTLATGGWDGLARLWDAAEGTPKATFPGHEKSVWAVAFSPDGRVLATAGLDRRVRLWTVPK